MVPFASFSNANKRSSNSPASSSLAAEMLDYRSAIAFYKRVVALLAAPLGSEATFYYYSTEASA